MISSPKLPASTCSAGQCRGQPALGQFAANEHLLRRLIAPGARSAHAGQVHKLDLPGGSHAESPGMARYHV
jgi:hypothetical protein